MGRRDSGKGGKGGHKGEKGPIRECAEDSPADSSGWWDYGDNLSSEEPDGVTGEEWYFDGIIGSITPAGESEQGSFRSAATPPGRALIHISEPTRPS